MADMFIPYNPATDPKQFAAQGLQGFLGGMLRQQKQRKLANWARQLDPNATSTELLQSALAQGIDPQLAIGMGTMIKQRQTQAQRIPPSKIVGKDLYERNPDTGKWELKVDVPEETKAPITRVIDKELYEYNLTTKKWKSTGVKATKEDEDIYGKIPGWMRGMSPEAIAQYQTQQIAPPERFLKYPAALRDAPPEELKQWRRDKARQLNQDVKAAEVNYKQAKHNLAIATSPEEKESRQVDLDSAKTGLDISKQKLKELLKAKPPTIPGLRAGEAARVGAVPGTPEFEAIAGKAKAPFTQGRILETLGDLEAGGPKDLFGMTIELANREDATDHLLRRLGPNWRQLAPEAVEILDRKWPEKGKFKVGQIIVNPTTKERRRWDGKRWVPIQ